MILKSTKETRMIFRRIFKKDIKPNFLNYPAKEKKSIITRAASLACQEQLALIRRYEEKYGSEKDL